MQINPVHALLQILRTETQKGSPPLPQEVQKINAAALAAAAEAEAISAAEADPARRADDPDGAGIHRRHGKDGRPEELGSRLAGHTSDAINRSKSEASGRGWNYTADKDGAKIMNHGDASATISANDAPVIGVALPYTPSREDMRHALLSGDGWPEDWGEPLRARLLREEARQEPDAPFELGYHAIALFTVLIVAAFFTLL